MAERDQNKGGKEDARQPGEAAADTRGKWNYFFQKTVAI